MVEIGSGSGSSYPGSLDTHSVPEVNSPNAAKTKVRAEVPNDLGSAIVAVQTELGTDPAGTTTDVKTFLQVEHNADGTHNTSPPDAPDIPGLLNMGQIGYSTTTAITLKASIININDGTTSRLVYWDSLLAFGFGPSGSNPGSASLGAKVWHYLYILDASVSSANIVAAGNFFNTTVAPSYNASRHGWYNASDRCIAAFRTNSSSQLEKFIDLGNGWIQPHGWQTGGFDNFLLGGSSTSYVALSPDVPEGTTAIQVNAQHSTTWVLYISTDGVVADFYIGGSGSSHVFRTAIGTGRQIYYKMGAGYINLYTSAYRTNY